MAKPGREAQAGEAPGGQTQGWWEHALCAEAELASISCVPTQAPQGAIGPERKSGWGEAEGRPRGPWGSCFRGWPKPGREGWLPGPQGPPPETAPGGHVPSQGGCTRAHSHTHPHAQPHAPSHRHVWLLLRTSTPSVADSGPRLPLPPPPVVRQAHRWPVPVSGFTPNSHSGACTHTCAQTR